MEKTLAAFEARRQFGTMLEDVSGRGDRIIVERHGKPVAAVVPIEVYEQWKDARARFFRRLEQIAERADVSPQDAEQLAQEAANYARLRT